MNEQAQKFISGQAHTLYAELVNIDKKEREASAAIQALSWERRRLYHQAKTFLEMLAANPKIREVEGFSKQTELQAGYFIHSYEEEQKKSPINRLLDWSSMSGNPGESFILAQAYDLLGKDDARTLRALVREVAVLADPKFAGDV